MGWLPSLVLLVMVGVVVLGALLVGLLRHLRRMEAASHRLDVAITGRTVRVKVGLAELRAWRTAHRHRPEPRGDA